MKEVVICGNLGSNAQMRSASDGRTFVSMSVAVNDRNGVTWFNVVTGYREKQFPYLIKGQQVIAAGDLGVSMYNGRPDLTVNADRVELVGTAANTEEQTAGIDPI